MATIDNLSIQVTASAESAASALDRLASSAGGLRGAATRAGGGLRDLSAGAKDAGTATQEAGQQAGNAEKHTRNFGRASDEAGKAAKRGTAGISSFWQALKRVAYYRFIRTIIKTITSAFSEGIKNIYSWSSAVNGHFAKSMNQLATATNYLKNSLGAMTAPLLEALAPVIDFVIDKVVALLNVFNQFFAALSGASTYTVAKKVAATWGDTTGGISSGADDATESIKELKRTILGFDEINKLDKFKMTGSGGGGSGSGGGGSGSSGGGIEFEEKPLEGFFKDLHDITKGWPDWLKWLFGIGGIAIAGWGISLLPKLIGKIWDALKRLFGITIPDWFKWLFGPKGDGDIDIDIPDHIDIPDGKVKVDIEKGDWSALDEIPSEKTLTLKVGVKMDGWIGDQTQQASLAVNGLSTINKQLERMVDNWDDLAWEVAQMPSGTIIDRTLSVAVKRSTNWDETAWDVANWEDGKVINISAAVALVKSWKGTALAALGLDNLSSNVYVKLVRSGWSTLAKYVGTYDANVYVKLVKSGWSSLAKYVGTYDANVYVKLVKSGWSSLAKYVGTYDANVYVKLVKSWKVNALEWLGLDNLSATISMAMVKSWKVSALEWLGLDNLSATISMKMDKTWLVLPLVWLGLDSLVATILVVMKKTWTGTALAALGLSNPSTNVYVKLVKSGWSTLAKYVGTYEPNVYVKLVRSGWSTLAKYVGTYEPNVYVKLVRSGWSTLAKYVGTYTANVKVVLKKDGWTDISSYLDNNFGGASGGGGKTSGGGAGRNNKYKVSIGLKDPTTKDTDNFWTRLGEAWNASVTAVDKGLDVVVRPVAKKAGGALSGFFSKVGEWLFGKSDTPETESKVKAVAGKGFSSVGNDGKMNLAGISDTEVGVNFKNNTFSEGIKKWLTGDYWGNIDIGINFKNNTFSEGIKKWLTGDYWGNTDIGIKLNCGDAGYYNFRNWLTGNIWGDVTTTVYLQKGWWGSLSDWIGNSVTVRVNLAKGGGVVNSNGYTASFADGGTISNGVARKFSKIPRYAGGTADAHGTLFLAGEAGPEIVGHVGGRTEILNQSQLAQTMFAAVRSAMSGVSIGGYIENAVPSGDSEADYETMYRAMYDAFTDAMTGSNERDKEKVALMRQIAAKEFTAEVTAASVNRAQTRMNRRAGTTIVPVGT